MLAFAACGGGRTQDVRASAPIATSVPASTAAPTTTATVDPSTTSPAGDGGGGSPATTTTPSSTPAPAPATPAVHTAPADDQGPATTAPTPASITVTYQPHDGATATATLEGTGRTASLASGAAVFDDLADGTYVVDVTVTYPNETSSDTQIGAQTITRSRPIAVQAGDHAVVSCTDQGCVGIA